MIKNSAFRFFGAMILASAMLSNLASAADGPTLHEVYQAADSGKMSEAQDMMQKVLRDHPNSAKAHFVEAELLAKQGRFASAETELANAERLEPGLAFAKPAAVQELKSLLAKAHAQEARSRPQAYSPAPSINQDGNGSSMPWGMIILGAGVVALIVFLVRRSNNGQVAYAPAGNRYGSVSPMQQTYAPNGYPQGYPQQPGMPAGGGIGSGIVGGLATGAAVGAGIVAGEALMHHFTDGDRRERSSSFSDQYLNNSDTSMDLTRNDDMGGADFGIADNSSWDDAGSGGSDDWDN